jgi:hypothetical protein
MNKNFAKVQLSAEEMRLVTDPAWILTKNSVIGKVVGMFAELAEILRLPPRTLLGADRRAPGSGGTEPKISKGENYKGLPWVMLDYPRMFGKEDVCAIRTFFWWGHAFSVTLHLKGEYMRAFLPGIVARRAELEAAGFGMGISDDEWAHEHTEETYGPLGADAGQALAGAENEMAAKSAREDAADPGSDSSVREGAADTRSGSSKRGTAERPWLKLSARVGLEHWKEAPEKLSALHSLLMEILSAKNLSTENLLDKGDR